MANYKYGDMVFAKCQNYPYWPGKIISTFQTSYKVLFYGEKSEATIDQTFIIPFTDQTYRKFSQESLARTSRELKYSLSVAYKRHNKRKKGLNSSSQEQDFFQQSQPKKEEHPRKNKVVTVTKHPEDPHIELAVLLNSLSEESSNYKPVAKRFTSEQESRLRILLEPQAGLLLPSLIEHRVIDRFIVTLKELELWGLSNYPELNQLYVLIRKRYEEYKALILSPQFASIPLREFKRERIVQKVLQNKAIL